jgi:GNAT superfamily N-acetyltransferase
LVSTDTRDTFLYTGITDPLARPLFDELSDEYATRYGESHSLKSPLNKEMNKYPPILFTPPGGAFLLLMREGEPIAGGAFMQIDARTVELKRIWTATAFRRQGLSTRVVRELEDEAARRGFTRIYLTTGSRQPEARNLYLQTGYTPLFDVEADPESIGLLAFEKVIEPDHSSPGRVRSVGERIHAWRQQRTINRAWTMRNPIPRRLDDLS